MHHLRVEAEGWMFFFCVGNGRLLLFAMKKNSNISSYNLLTQFGSQINEITDIKFFI